MKRASILLLCVASCVSLAFGQQTTVNGYTTVIPLHTSSNSELSSAKSGPRITNVTPIPMWNDSAVGFDGAVYSGTIMGRSPYLRGKTTTTIPLQIVPLIITIDNGNGDVFTYDPTVPDACVTPGTHTPVDVVMGSPLLQNNDWVMNGIDVGNTQYEDAFQRAQFWSLVGGSTYHLVFSPSVLDSQTLTFGKNGTSGIGENFVFGACAPEGVVNIDQFDAAIESLIAGPLASMVNAGTFPVFVTRNVVSSTNGINLNECCVLGYHSALLEGANLQVYAPFTIDTNQLFGPGYTTTMAHELGEAINDPTTKNPTPLWGNEGQTVNTCQNNLEVGDPLSGGFGTPTHPFTVAESNGVTYSLQELAFFSWFYGGPSLGTGGLYSNNGTFTGQALPCPPGGSNQ